MPEYCMTETKPLVNTYLYLQNSLNLDCELLFASSSCVMYIRQPFINFDTD